MELVREERSHFPVADGDSEAYFHNPNQQEPTYKGEVAVARITNTDATVPVKPVFDDMRT